MNVNQHIMYDKQQKIERVLISSRHLHKHKSEWQRKQRRNIYKSFFSCFCSKYTEQFYVVEFLC